MKRLGKRKLSKYTSHTTPEDRQARLSGEGVGIFAKGEIPLLMHAVHLFSFSWITRYDATACIIFADVCIRLCYDTYCLQENGLLFTQPVYYST